MIIFIGRLLGERITQPRSTNWQIGLKARALRFFELHSQGQQRVNRRVEIFKGHLSESLEDRWWMDDLLISKDIDDDLQC